LTATFHYREGGDDGDDDDDSDDLSNDQWYETFSVNAEEKIYDDLCSVMSSKVDQWLRSGIVKCPLVLLVACYLSVSSLLLHFHVFIYLCIDTMSTVELCLIFRFPVYGYK